MTIGKFISEGDLVFILDTVKDLEEYVKEENDPDQHDFLSTLENVEEVKKIINKAMDSIEGICNG